MAELPVVMNSFSLCMLSFKIVYSLILKDSDADVLHFWSLVSGLSPPSLFKKNTVF